MKAFKPHIIKRIGGWAIRWMDWNPVRKDWVPHETLPYPHWLQAWRDYESWIK